MNYRESTFSWIACELCTSMDTRAHYLIENAKRGGLHVVEVNNRYFALIVNDYVYRG